MQSRKLKKQLVKYFETDDFQGLIEVLKTGPPEVRAKLAVDLDGFMAAIDRLFEQDAKKLDIATHSLEISSDELRTQHAQLDQASRQIEHMLDSMDEGFLLVNRSGLITSAVSKKAVQMVGFSPVGKEIWNCLGMHNDPASVESIKEWFFYLFETYKPLPLFDLAPEFMVGADVSRKIQLSFKPVLDASDRLESVLVIATDISDRVAAEAEQRRLQSLSDMIISRYQKPSDFFRALQLYNDVLTQFKGSTKIHQDEALQSLHTLKGVVALFRIEILVDAVHSAETDAKDWSPDVCDGISKNLSQSFSSFEAEFTDLLQLSGRRESSKQISVDRLKDFYRSMPPSETAAKFYESFLCDSLETLLEPLKFKAMISAEKTGKRIEVSLRAPPLRFEATKFVDLVDALNHVISNAVDHGIRERGKISIDCYVVLDDLIIEISDDGRGIDVDALADKYQRLNVNVAGLSGTDLIFVPGLSSKSEVSLISGRGIGMSAVKSVIENMRGQIQVSTKKDEGSHFKIIIPMDTLRPSAFLRAG